MSNRTSIYPTGLTPNFSGTTAFMTSDERNAKLAVGSTWSGSGKTGRLADFPCHLLMRGIEDAKLRARLIGGRGGGSLAHGRLWRVRLSEPSELR
jgi:hypothetical protein